MRVDFVKFLRYYTIAGLTKALLKPDPPLFSGPRLLGPIKEPPAGPLQPYPSCTARKAQVALQRPYPLPPYRGRRKMPL